MADLRRTLGGEPKAMADMAIHHNLPPSAMPSFAPSGAARVAVGMGQPRGTLGAALANQQQAREMLSSVMWGQAVLYVRDYTRIKTIGSPGEPKVLHMIHDGSGNTTYTEVISKQRIDASEYTFAAGKILEQYCMGLYQVEGLSPMEQMGAELQLRKDYNEYVITIVRLLEAHPRNNADILRLDNYNRQMVHSGGAVGWHDKLAFNTAFMDLASDPIAATRAETAAATAQRDAPARKDSAFRSPNNSGGRGGRSGNNFQGNAIHGRGGGNRNNNNGNANGYANNTDICNNFNAGNCRRNNCRYVHKCNVANCNATDHGAHQHAGRGGGGAN